MIELKRFIARPWVYAVIHFIGIALKFYHIDYCYLWLDEISKIEQTSGVNREGLSEQMTENKIITIRNYEKLLKTKVF